MFQVSVITHVSKSVSNSVKISCYKICHVADFITYIITWIPPVRLLFFSCHVIKSINPNETSPILMYGSDQGGLLTQNQFLESFCEILKYLMSK